VLYDHLDKRVKSLYDQNTVFWVIAALGVASFATVVRPIAPVVRVTTLAANGPGSLRAALETPGARLVVFEVGGVIDLGGRTLTVRHPYLIVAGQTAPDPGITLIRGGLIVETHDVAIHHIAVRPGDNDRATPGWAPDALGVRQAASPVFNVLFENCSATWAVDENLSASGPADGATARDITIRNCLIAEALSNSTHPKGEHSKGTLIHDGVRNVRIEGSLYAHNRERNPRLKSGSSAVISNSVMYNWGSACIAVGASEAVVTGNVAIAGPDTRGKTFIKGLDPGGRVFLGENVVIGKLAMVDERVVVKRIRGGAPSLERVLRTAGSRPARRDPIDARIVQSVINRDGRIIDSQNDVGGYPVRPSTKRALIIPAARQQWLDKLSRELAIDATLDIAPLQKRLNAPQIGAPLVFLTM
jgi:hypothetical protein